MSPTLSGIELRKVPEAVKKDASVLSITDEQCLFSVQSDLTLDGTSHETWLLILHDSVVTFATNSENGKPVTGPFDLKQVTKVRCFQTVGSAFLQVMIDGFYVDVVRYSNARREAFGRARTQLERMIDKKPLQEEDLRRPSDLICEQCGLPRPSRKAPCPRCNKQHGILARTLKLVSSYWRSIIFLLVMMIAGVGLDLLPAQLTRVLVDKVLLPKENIDWLPFILLGLVGVSAVRSTLNIFIGRTSTKVGTRITKELREKLEQKLVSLSVDYYNQHSVGSLMSRVLYDVEYFHGFVVQVAQGFLLNLMQVLGIGTMLFFMNVQLALWVLVPIPFVIMGTLFFWKHVYPRYYRLWESNSKMAQMLSSLLSGIRLVKSFGQEERENQRFSQGAEYMLASRRRVDVGTATFNPIMGFVFGLGGLVVWYAGGHLVLDDEITLGTLMAFLGYLGMFYSPISALSMFSNWVTGFLSSGQRIFEILDANQGVQDSANAVHIPRLRGEVEFRNVTFGYDPYTPILKNVSFKIAPGRFIGIVGKSGSGKTTIVNLLCRFYDPQEGQILIDGVDVREISADDLHRQVGLVLQEPFLFRGSIAENVAYGRPNASAVSVMNASKSANAHDFIARRANAYDTKLGEHGAGLSGGERQRVSIARALLCDPRVLILDEATSSVDTESEQEIQKALIKLCKGRTTIAIAHRLSTLKNSDHIFVIDDGKIAEAGSHEELMAIPNGIYHELVMIQTRLTKLEL